MNKKEGTNNVSEAELVPEPDVAEIAYWRELVRDIPMVRHDSPEAVDARMWGAASASQGIDYTAEEAAGTVFVGIDADGKEHETPYADMMAGMREMGMWGFCDGEANPPEVHYWRSGDANEIYHPMLKRHIPEAQMACSFFAHELAHAILEPLLEKSTRPHPELLAGVVEEISLRAFEEATNTPCQVR